MTSASAWLVHVLCAWLSVAWSAGPAAQSSGVKELIAGLASDDAAARARAACELTREGDLAAAAIPALLQLLADASPVERATCGQHWWRNSDLLTTPGELAATALVAVGTRAFEPLIAALRQPQWVARRNAAWALGALRDGRAVQPLLAALDDREPDVRAQAAWALGALDASASMERLAASLKDEDARVRRQAAWALGALGDARATGGLLVALRDSDARVRRQAAWALGVIGK